MQRVRRRLNVWGLTYVPSPVKYTFNLFLKIGILSE